MVMLLLLLLEGAVTADILLNPNWEEVTLYSQYSEPPFCSFLVFNMNQLFLDLQLLLCTFQDLPEDPSGKFDGFRDFVTSNLEICKWVGLVIISAQVKQSLIFYIYPDVHKLNGIDSSNN